MDRIRSLISVYLVTAMLGVGSAARADPSSGTSRLTVMGKEVFLPSPGPGVRMVAFAAYARATGVDMISYSCEQSRSDTAENGAFRLSADNGRNWSAPRPSVTHEKLAEGTRRRYVRAMLTDPVADVLIVMINDAVLPTDHPLEGMKHWTLRYALSRDGGRTFYHESPVVQAEKDYSPSHPLPGVWVGKNSVMIGDKTCVPIRTRSGAVVQPVQVTPIGASGEYENAGGGLTYHDAGVLIGRWNAAGRIDWRLSALVRGDAARSTRGMLEPTIAQVPDGRILMVLRGSNDRKPELPGYRWYAVSSDGGETWSEPRVWTYADGSPFFSPSSCSQLLSHSNGRLYWIGNITPANPHGNAPRYPLVIGEVDGRSLLLIRDSICIVDDRRPDDSDTLQLSNFHAREDRVSHDIVIHCSPLGRGGQGDQRSPTTHRSRQQLDWTADAWIYRVHVTKGSGSGPTR